MPRTRSGLAYDMPVSPTGPGAGGDLPPPPPDTPHDTIIRYRQQIVEKGLAGAPRFDGTASSFTVFEDTLANLADTYPATQSGITMADMITSDLPQRLSAHSLTQAPPLLNGLLHTLLSPLMKEAADIMTSANRVEGKTSDGAHVLASRACFFRARAAPEIFISVFFFFCVPQDFPLPRQQPRLPSRASTNA